jgi:diguanylate cyclase (GGDEF)-like protein
MQGPLGRLEREREQLAKAWLVRVIERASLEEIQSLPTDRIARELPDLISDLLHAVDADSDGDPTGTMGLDRAARIGALRGRAGDSAADLARDITALQTVLLGALHRQTDAPGELADVVERLSEGLGEIQAVAFEELQRSRSRELESAANTDPLTGLFNLRYLQAEIAQLLGVSKRYEHPFAVLILDLDGLKRINDGHGHAAGDRVLMQISLALRRTIRTVDTAARIGGDEFCVLAPEQDAEAATVLAARVAAAVEEEEAAPDMPPVSVSIGVVSCPAHGEDADTLLEAADQAMYRAKSGGERVAVAETPSTSANGSPG